MNARRMQPTEPPLPQAPLYPFLPLQQSVLPIQPLLVPSLNQLVVLQNQVLQQILSQSKQMAQLISRIDSCSAGSTRCSSQASSSDSTEAYTLKLALEGDIATQVLKERGFVLKGTVRDSENRLAVQSVGMVLRLELYTQDDQTHALVHNIAGRLYTGKKIMRGSVTACVQADACFAFPNVVINEVSSHYIDDAFSLVISADQFNVKPLVIRKIVVRARKAKAISMCNEVG